MKRRDCLGLAAALLVACAMLAGACGGNDDSGGDLAGTSKLNVVATTVQVGALAKAVGGDAINLTVLIKAGVDPHEFEPQPDDLKKIADAKLILKNGIGLDDWLDKVIKNAGGGKRLVTVTDGITLREGSAEEKKDNAKAKDPHVWHDPENDKLIIDKIAGAFAAADAKDAAAFQANAAAAKQRFDDVEKLITSMVDTLPAQNRKMVTDHDAFGYFLDRFGLKLIGTVIPGTTTQAEPSAKDIAALEDLIRREGVKALFSEQTASPKLAQRIAADTGAKIIDTLYGDSLGAPGSGQETVDGMLLFNAKTIVEALR